MFKPWSTRLDLEGQKSEVDLCALSKHKLTYSKQGIKEFQVQICQPFYFSRLTN